MASRLQHDSAYEEIEKYEQAVCKHIKRVNQLADLLAFAQTPHPKISLRAIEALGRVFNHLDQRYATKPIVTGKQSVDQYNTFVRAQFLAFIRHCLSMLCKKSNETTIAAMHVLMGFLKRSSETKMRDTRDFYFDSELFDRIMFAMLDPAGDKEEVLNEFVSSYLAFDDIRLFTLMSIDKFIKQTAKEEAEETAGAPKTKRAKKMADRHSNRINNIYMILHQLEMPQSADELGNMYVSVTPKDIGVDGDDEFDDLDALMDDPMAGSGDGGDSSGATKSSKGRKSKVMFGEMAADNDVETAQEKRMPIPLRYAMHKRHFTACWESFLSMKLSKDVLRNVLETLDERVMPFYSRPKQLLDFLSSAFHSRGVLAILSLNALFVLMHVHNLEYPRFFEQLYSLLEPGIFHVKYRAKFFQLLNLFLSSTHLPAYVAAAFAKRLARLALNAPVHGCVISCQMIYNLLKRHPVCKTLIHKNSNDVGETPSSEGDPYIYDEPDLSKCRAKESSLWELEPLLHHYSPEVIKAANALKIPALRKGERRMEKTTLASYDSLFKADAEWAVPDEVSTTFIPPSMGFMQHSGDCFTSLWSAEDPQTANTSGSSGSGSSSKKGDNDDEDDNTLLDAAQARVDELRKAQEESDESSSDDDDSTSDESGDSDDDDDDDEDDGFEPDVREVQAESSGDEEEEK